MIESLIETILKKEVGIEDCINEFQSEFDSNYNDSNNWSNPDMRPNRFDRTFEGWIERISSWGSLEFIHTDLEHGIRKSKISRDKFLKSISTSDLLKVYGKFRVEIIDVNCIEFIRDYVGMDGKTYSEVFRVKVHLLPELKKGLHWITNTFRS